MDADVLMPNIQDLQKRVINLLEQVSDLMNSASKKLWFEDGSESRYEIYQHEVDKERGKVENLELRMAIAAPMNTGKSTIINAIIGQELLPSSATAMTTLPTEIVFKVNATQPILKLSDGIRSAFEKAFLALKGKIDQHGINEVINQTGEYPHLAGLLTQINTMQDFPVPSEIAGSEEINKILTNLNHIIRLCSILELSEDPLQSLDEKDVPRIETPFFRVQQNQQSEKLGNLVIVDTPGPNESGVSTKLEYVVSKQLANSQLVLIVLDFTQLKAQPAEKIKDEVQKVIRTRGKQNLYVLVNKVDQRRKGDMDTDMVRQFVANNLQLVNIDDTDRVFEISARQAFCSMDFLRESQQSSDIKASEAAQALAQEIWRVDWEEELEDATVEKLQRKAGRLWQESGFAPFLEKAINVIMEQVAPRCMESALNLCLVRLDSLCESVQARRSYIDSDAQKLKKAIDELNQELASLADCRKRLEQEVGKTKKQIDVTVNGNLERLKTNVIEKLDSLLISYAVDSFRNAIARVSKYFMNLLNGDTGEFEFENEEDAKSFATKIADFIKQVIETELNSVCENTEKQTEILIQELSSLLERRTQPIIKRAQERLKKDFDVHFSSEPLRIVDVYVKLNKPKGESKYTDDFVDFLKNLFDGLFISVFNEVILNNPLMQSIRQAVHMAIDAVTGWFSNFFGFQPQKKGKYYINLIHYRGEVIKLFESKVEEVKQEAKEYTEGYFEKKVEIYFKALDACLGEYKNDLEQSLKDKELPVKTLEQLKQALDSFADGAGKLEVDKLKEEAETLRRDTNLLISNL